ncbi:hypothetical protein MKEN_00200700 [Mycena kentingensis (nom. inval.)]|nr:hypothetical protein MKEN_00200700 [Mycena kentingensis (nom. inval.)]
MNPYAQGGWNGPSSSHSHTGLPVLYGALPYPTAASCATAPTFICFTFTYTDSILNSTVTGPQNRVYFRVSTDTTSPSRSIITAEPDGTSVARVEWRTYPVFELRGLVQRNSTAQWLPLSASQTYRTMTVRGRTYRWTPRDSHIELAGAPPSAGGGPQLLGRVSQGQTPQTTVLSVTPEAIQIGLLEPAVLATIFLLCGRNID